MKKRIISLMLAMIMVITAVPLSAVSSSASFTGALQFDSAGKFTVMQIADIQESTTVNSRVVSLLTNAISRYHPDLCVFTGDNQTGGSFTYKSVIDKFLAPLNNTSTKFAVTFGNHDEEGWPSVSRQTQYDYYKSKGGSNFIDHDVSSLTGVGSGAIPIYAYGQSSGTPAFQVYLMDSGTYASSGYNCPYTDQIDYYIQRSQSYPSVPSLWFMHIIVPDVYTETMIQVPSGTPNSYTGSGSPFSSYTWTLDPAKIDWTKSSNSLSEIYKEPPCPADQSTYESTAHRSSATYGSKTLYESWVAYGNMLGTYYGHDHKNSFVTRTDDGIDIGYGKAPTLTSYNDGNPGLRIFQLDSNGTYTSESVTEADMAKAMVSFDANGGTGTMANQYITKNSTAALYLNTYTRPGYTFAGWATAASGSVAYANGANYTAGSSDAVLYAKWNAVSNINITFNANGGTGGTGPTAMQAGAALTAPTVSRTGYSFAGWSPAVPATVPAADTTYTAQWTAITYTIAYDANTGSGATAGSSHTYDTVKALTANGFTKTGYTFTGWNTVANGSGTSYSNGQNVVNLASANGATVTLYAQWSVNSYMITFDANGGTGGTGGQMAYGAVLSAPSVTRPGYTFTGWIPAVPATVPAADTTYTAQWSQNTVLITFNANGGTGGTSAAMVPGTPFTAPTVTKTGYSLTGWSPALPSTVPVVDFTYTAQWIINSYTITFDANGGTGGTSSQMQYGAVLTPPEVIRTGYTFLGWSPIPETVPAANTTYTAQWSVNSYTITFDANGGAGGTSGSLPFGSPLQAPQVLKEGYSFAGWTPAVPSTVPAANATYTANWIINKYLITFDENGGIGGTSGLYIFDEPLSAPSVSRTGYTFTGWSPTVPLTVPAQDTVYQAQWKVNSYTITFDAGGGTGGTSGSYTYGSALSAPAVSRPGYTFAGWSPAVPATVPAANTTYIAQWNPNSYLITFDANGGSGGTSAPMSYGSVLNAPVVTRFGYTLAGWSPSLPATVPGTDTVYIAQWTPNKYLIIFDANGGTGGSSTFMAYESVLEAPAVSKAGYTLEGWSPAVPSKVPAADTTYTAQWSANRYTITFDANGGTGGTSSSMLCGAALSAPAVEKTGYNFTGWLPEVPAAVPAGDKVFVAQWSPKSYTITFDANGGAGGKIETLYFGDALAAPAVTKTGYRLTGWSPALPETVPAGNTTYIAQWAPNSYTIIFDANGGTGGSSGTLDFGAQITAPAVARTGYTFTGWSPTVPATMPAQDATFVAQWSVNSYTITFNANGGLGGTSYSLVYGSVITPPVATKLGYIFAGWSPALPATMPAYPVQFTANWIPAKYDAIFMVDGTEYARVPTAYGEAIVEPVMPEKTGNIFLGWDPGIPVSMPNQNITFNAVWFLLSFTISFDLNGGMGSAPAQQKKEYGSAVTLPAQGNITKQNCIFLGWAASANATAPLESFYVPGSDATLYAVWAPKVSLVAAEGSSTVFDVAKSFIYGLRPGITKDVFENEYAHINGNASLVYTYVNGTFGTGTKVDLVDNETNTVIGSFRIVIFGDVNGDGNVDAHDADSCIEVQNWKITWNHSTQDYNYLAGDLNGDGNIDALDADLMTEVANYRMHIDQSTGLAVPN